MLERLTLLESVHREIMPLHWTKERLGRYRWYGALETSIASAFYLRDDLPVALCDAELFRQPTESVPERVWDTVAENLRKLVRTTTITTDLPITRIDEMTNSKAASDHRIDFATVDAFARHNARLHDRKGTQSLLDAALDRGNRRFVYVAWRDRLRWSNDDGSHRMAAAINQNRDEPPVFVRDATVTLEWLDREAVELLVAQVAMFLMPPGDQQQRYRRRGSTDDLSAILPDQIPWRSAEIWHHGRRRDVLFLPLSDSRCRSLARAMRNRLTARRREVGDALRRLAAAQLLPPRFV